jgi:hypothetical protein
MYKVFQALQVNSGSVTPGAIYNGSYVFFDEERNQYGYVPDMQAPHIETWWLDYDQVLRLVIGANSSVWTPVRNFVF